jgi:catechol 2,3-dioxygenase-like lactoylglutathione lyase family enzyme
VLTGIHHVGLTVTDPSASREWYERVLGLTYLGREEHSDGSGYAELLIDPSMSVLIGLHLHHDADGEPYRPTRPGLDHVGFGVESLDALAEWCTRLDGLGVVNSSIHGPDAPIPYRVVSFRDPDGIALELIAMVAPPD